MCTVEEMIDYKSLRRERAMCWRGIPWKVGEGRPREHPTGTGSGSFNICPSWFFGFIPGTTGSDWLGAAWEGE